MLALRFELSYHWDLLLKNLFFVVLIAGCGIARDELVLLGEKYGKLEFLFCSYL